MTAARSTLLDVDLLAARVAGMVEGGATMMEIATELGIELSWAYRLAKRDTGRRVYSREFGGIHGRERYLIRRGVMP